MENFFSKGIRIWTQKTQMFLKGVKQILVFATIISCFFALYKIFCITDWKSFYYFLIERYAQVKLFALRLIDFESPKIEFYSFEKGGRVNVSIKYFVQWFWNQSSYGKKILQLIFWVKYKSLVELTRVFLGSISLGVIFFSTYGLNFFRQDRSKILSLKALSERFEKGVTQKKSFKISGIRLPYLIERHHFFLSGTTGTGKTNLVKHILKEIRLREEKAVIFDLTGEFKETFFRSGDIEINPFDKSSKYRWFPHNEFEKGDNSSEISNIVKALFPDSKTRSKDFFEESARQVLKEAFARSKNLAQVQKIFLGTREEICEEFKETLVYNLLNSNSKETAGSIVATVVSGLSKLECLEKKGQKNKGQTFSIKNWIRGSEKNWLFFSATPDQRNSLRALLCIWADICIRGLMLKGSFCEKENVWIILDELSAFENIPSLATGLNELRKYGGCIVGAAQNIAQLRDIYGYSGAQAMLDTFSNKFVFRSGEYEIAEYFSRFFGEKREKEKKESISLGGEKRGDSIHIGETEKKKSIIAPEDILKLPDNECFVNLAGIYPVGRAKFKIFSNKSWR